MGEVRLAKNVKDKAGPAERKFEWRQPKLGMRPRASVLQWFVPLKGGEKHWRIFSTFTICRLSKIQEQHRFG